MIRDSMEVKPAALCAARRRALLSQRALAEACGVSRPFIVMLERGSRLRCRRSTAVAICQVLEVPIAELFSPRQYDIEDYGKPREAVVTG